MSEASDEERLPWGVRFRYRSSGKAQVTRAVVRAAVRDAVPDWEIREALEDGWFEAVPRSLPDYAAVQPAFHKAFAERFEHGYQTLKAVTGVCDAAPVDGTTRDLMRAFLADPSDDVVEEFRLLIEPVPALQTWLRRWRRGAPRLPLLSRLIERPARQATGESQESPAALSKTLREHLEGLRDDDTEGLQERYRWQIADVGQLKPDRARNDHSEITEPLPPQVRQLRAYAFDPTLATTLKTEPIHQVTIPTRWEESETRSRRRVPGNRGRRSRQWLRLRAGRPGPPLHRCSGWTLAFGRQSAIPPADGLRRGHEHDSALRVGAQPAGLLVATTAVAAPGRAVVLSPRVQMRTSDLRGGRRGRQGRR